MPTKFDTRQYTSNWNPITKGSFVQTQNVMDDVNGIWEQVWTAIMDYLSNTTTSDEVNSVIQQSITGLLNDLFPSTSGATSSLITELTNWTGVNFTTLNNQLTTLETDFNSAITTGDWNPLLDVLFGTTAFESSSKVMPTAVGSSNGLASLEADITALITDFDSAITTGDWNPLLNLLFGSTAIGSTVQVAALPTNIPQSYINGLTSALTTFVTTGNFNPLLSALFGSTTVGSTVQVSALPTNIPQSNINGLSAALTTFVTTGNYTPLLTALFGGNFIGSTLVSAAVPNISAGTGPGQSADLQNHFNNLVAQYQMNGAAPAANQTVTQALAAIQTVANTISGLSAKVQNQVTQQTGSNLYGKSYMVSFSNYPDGAFSQTPFSVTYSGAGSGSLSISKGTAVWNGVSNGDVSVLGLYISGFLVTFTGSPTSFTLTYNGVTTAAISTTATPAAVQAALQGLSNMPANNVTVAANPGGGYSIALTIYGSLSATGTGGTATAAKVYGVTNTDYQSLQASISGLPNGTNSRNYAILRSNAAGTTYVYGVVYLNASYQLCWELGCYVNGTKTVLGSGVNAPLNYNFTFRAGVGNNPYRFQGVSGNAIVFDITDSSHVSQVGSAYRCWGFRSDTANNGASTPAPAAFVGTSDNTLPATQGSGFRASCSSPTARSLSITVNNSPPSGTPVWQYFPVGFFDTVGNITPDIVQSSTGGYDSVTILTEGWYLFELRCQQNAVSGGEMVSIYAGYLHGVQGGGLGAFEQIANGPSVAVNAFGTGWAPTSFGGNCPIYCKAGDTIVPMIYCDTNNGGYLSSFSIYGEVNNRMTYWSMTRMFGK